MLLLEPYVADKVLHPNLLACLCILNDNMLSVASYAAVGAWLCGASDQLCDTSPAVL